MSAPMRGVGAMRVEGSERHGAGLRRTHVLAKKSANDVLIDVSYTWRALQA